MAESSETTKVISEDAAEWPSKYLRILLWPIADFEWRHKRNKRVRRSRFTLVHTHPMEEDGFRQPVGIYPLFIRADGTIRFDCPREHHVERVDIRKHSKRFDFCFPDDFPSTVKGQYGGLVGTGIPVVSGDGRFIRIRDPEGRTFRAFTFENGIWQEWRVEEEEAWQLKILWSGYDNYRLIGTTISDWTFILGTFATVLFIIILFVVAVLFS